MRGDSAPIAGEGALAHSPVRRKLDVGRHTPSDELKGGRPLQLITGEALIAGEALRRMGVVGRSLQAVTLQTLL